MAVTANFYVCSKPLQYFNVRNLPKHPDRKHILIIENKFNDARLFYERVARFDTDWDEVIFAEDRSKVFLLTWRKYRVENVYYYLDFMFRASMMLLALNCRNIYVYEEGISAYRSDIFRKTPKFKRVLRKLIGLSEYPGLHPRTRGIYVYRKEKYISTFSELAGKKKLRPLSFVQPFNDMISNNMELAVKLFGIDKNHPVCGLKGKSILVYLTSWPLNENALDSIAISEYDHFIIKPHPHITDFVLPASWVSPKTIVIDSLILPEFLIRLLTDQGNQLSIYHHNSSAVMYLQKHSNIRSVTSLSPKRIQNGSN